MIRTVTLISIIVFFILNAQSQSNTLERILDIPPQQIGQVTPSKEPNTVIIPSSFSQESIQTVSSKPKGTLNTVYYIYTAYRQNESFNQKQLNEKRIRKLLNAVPELAKNPYIEWKVIEQTACTSAEEGRSFFHGFVLQYFPEVSDLVREQEIANLEVFLKNPKAGFESSNDPSASILSNQITDTKTEVHATSGTKSSEANFPDGNFALYQYLKKNIPANSELARNKDDLWVPFTMTVDENGDFKDFQFKNGLKDYIQSTILETFDKMPKWNPATENGKPISSKVNLELRMSFSPIVRGMYNRDGKKPDFTQDEVAELSAKNAAPDQQTEERISKAEQSAVYRSMEEVIPKEKIALVMDVTTSMSQHLAAMNWWVANSADSLNIVHYTFFNDGDNMDDQKKKAGRTGGIHHGNELRDLPATLLESMRRGNGGDIVENDFEAVLAAQNQQIGADAILLIVDNFSDVRDENLMDQINMKTYVLIAGDVSAPRECYLNLAKATGGAILFDGKRISLENVHSGGRVTIGNATYLFDGKKFTIL